MIARKNGLVDRRYKPRELVRSERLIVRMTRDEMAAIEELAEASRQSVAEYVRRVLLGSGQ